MHKDTKYIIGTRKRIWKSAFRWGLQRNQIKNDLFKETIIMFIEWALTGNRHDLLDELGI